MPSELILSWNTSKVKRDFDRAVGRGTLGIGERIAVAAKRNVHVITGTLRRSIHTARAGSGGAAGATAGNILDRIGAVLEVGSWIEYACVEEIGRGHRYMQPAFEEVRPQGIAIMRAAFKAEGF